MPISRLSPIIALLVVVATSTAQSFEDCSTSELKAEAIGDFLEEHYDVGFLWIGRALKGGQSYSQMPTDGREVEIEEDPELMNVIFSADEGCEGVVRVNDDCDITTVGGLSLRYARERENAFKCEG